MTAPQLSIWFFIQMFFILAVCHTTGWLAKRYFGQPQVVGEMIAGVLLGPSFFGLLFPEWQQLLFPKESLKTLYVGAQLGVGLYMFLVGLDFRTDLFRTRARSAVSVSAAGILVPFGLSIALAPWLLSISGLFSAKATVFEATLFLGAAISITAFPMLARIIYERKLSGTALGTLALAAGAIDDMAAWCILAVVLASFGAGPKTAIPEGHSTPRTEYEEASASEVIDATLPVGL
jgi:Kef-type K+ transport system membrane component KefB